MSSFYVNSARSKSVKRFKSSKQDKSDVSHFAHMEKNRILPSIKLTKSRNLQLLTRITGNYQIFKMKNTQAIGLKNFNISELHSSSAQDQVQMINEKRIQLSKWDSELMELDGIKYPINLYMIQQIRQNQIKFIQTSRQIVDSNPFIEQQKEIVINKILNKESLQRTQDYRSRNQMKSAYYGLLAMNQGSKQRVRKHLSQILPQESHYL